MLTFLGSSGDNPVEVFLNTMSAYNTVIENSEKALNSQKEALINIADDSVSQPLPSTDIPRHQKQLTNTTTPPTHENDTAVTAVPKVEP